jgi:type VI protein secretion system component VasF
MTLVEICEPLFQYVCKINRMGRAGAGTLGVRQVRDEVKGILADLKAKADRDGHGGQFDKIELPLIFFADHMIRESRLAASWGNQGGWKNLAEERREMAGDERFWDLLEDTLLEPGDTAVQRLAVFHSMIGLGFTGFYANQPDHLRRKTREIAAKVRGLAESDQSGRVTPDAYENVDTRTLTQPPARKIIGLVIALIVLSVVLLASYVISFRSATKELSETLSGLKSGDSAAAPVSTPTPAPSEPAK